MNDSDFFSIDRLVEFGLGVSIAQQMARSMNETMSKMQMPGQPMPASNGTGNLYYAMIDGQQEGPLSESELARLIAQKRIVSDTYLWKPGMPQWATAEHLPEVLRLVLLTPPTFHPTPQQP